MLDLLKNMLAKLKGKNHEEPSHNIPNKFVIFSTPRTGSTFLCDALNSHPEVLCHYDLFHDKDIYYSGNYLKNGGEKLGSPQTRDRSPKSFMAQIWKQDFGYKAIGFKLMLWQNKKAFDLVLKDKNTKKILLLRRNKLKSYVSEKIAAKTKVWVMPDAKLDKQGQNEPQISITVKPKSLYDYLKNIDNFYDDLRKKLKASNQSFLEITYEDLFGSESEVAKVKTLEFIGVLVKPECLTSNLKKQNPQKLSQLIENFSELEEALKGSELEPYLYAPDF